MENWNNKTSKLEETPEKVIDFLNEITVICEKYNMSISHEDGHGSFEIETFSAENIDWLRSANLSF